MEETRVLIVKPQNQFLEEIVGSLDLAPEEMLPIDYQLFVPDFLIFGNLTTFNEGYALAEDRLFIKPGAKDLVRDETPEHRARHLAFYASAIGDGKFTEAGRASVPDAKLQHLINFAIPFLRYKERFAQQGQANDAHVLAYRKTVIQYASDIVRLLRR